MFTKTFINDVNINFKVANKIILDLLEYYIKKQLNKKKLLKVESIRGLPISRTAIRQAAIDIFRATVIFQINFGIAERIKDSFSYPGLSNLDYNYIFCYRNICITGC